MMMGLGSFGYGGPSSSSSSSSPSNLSALAPPFTVDRFNSKPNSNPLVQFPESPYGAAFGHTWQYSNPSASIPHMYQQSELGIDSSTRITSVPLPDDYGFRYSMSQASEPQPVTWSTMNPGPKTSSTTLLYESKVDSFYSPYISSMVSQDSSLAPFSEPAYDLLPSSGLVSDGLSSEVDYSHNLHCLEYSTQLHGVWDRTLDGKLGNQAELLGSSFLDKTRTVGSTPHVKQMNQENSGISSGQFFDVVGIESSNGLVRAECRDNVSHLVQKVPSIPLDSSKKTISSSSFTIPTSHPPGLSLHSSPNSTNYHWPQRCSQTLDSSVSGPIFVTKSSPAFVIRPPISASAVVPQKAASGKSLGTGNVAASHHGEGIGKANPLKGKEPQILLDSEVEKCSLFTSQVKCQKECNSQLFSAPSVIGVPPNKPQSRNSSKVKFESPIRNIDAADGSSLSADNFQAVKSFDIGPDCLDHHSFAVDSPCWKGAPASNFSPFDVMETETTHQFGTRKDKFCQLDLEANQTFPPLIDPMRCSSVNAGDDKVHACGNAGRGVSAIPRNISEVDCTAADQLFDAVKAILKGPNLTNCKGVQFSEEFDEPRENYDLPKNSKNSYESKSSGMMQLGVEENNITISDLSFQATVMDSLLNISDATDGAIAVRAAGNVLCSSSSEEGASEEAKPHGGQLPPKMDVEALIKVLHSLSDLLLFSLSDSSALKDQEIEVIRQVIRNLDRLTSRKVEYFTESKEQLHQQYSCEKVGDSPSPQMSNAAGKFQFENEAGEKSHNRLSRDYRLRNRYVNHEKPANFPLFNHPRDDLDVLGDDNMAQAIQKVLEEHFLYGEDLESQALLFKNLWLEAEAKLCSISYRVRFDRMKMEMEKFKCKQAKESAAVLEKTAGSDHSSDLNKLGMPSSMVGDDSNLKSTIWSLPSSSSTSKANAVQASITTKFDTLKHRDDLSCTNLVVEEVDIVGGVTSDKTPFLQDQAKDRGQKVAVESECEVNQDYLGFDIGDSGNQPIKDGLRSTSNSDDVEASVMTRFHILKCRDSKTTNAMVEQAGKGDTICSDMMPFLKGQAEDARLNLAVAPRSQTTGDVNQRFVGLHVDGPMYEFVKDFFPPMPDDRENQNTTNAQRNQHSIGSSDNFSSDWEHVLKDEVSWR